MDEAMIISIDATTKDTNTKTTKLCDDVVHSWSNIKENRERIAVNSNIVKDIPDLIKKFYHMEKIVTEGNGSPSLISVVTILKDKNNTLNGEIKSLKHRFEVVEEDTKKNSVFIAKATAAIIVIAVVLPKLIDKLF